MLHADGTPAKMSWIHRTFLVLVLVLTVIPGWKLLATLPAPEVVMTQAVPVEARPLTIVTVTGYALDPQHIQALFLVDDQDTAYQADILAMSGDELRFRVPAKAPAGLMRIAIKAPDKAGLIDQMIYLKILEPAG
jgi:hypothetical protein